MAPDQKHSAARHHVTPNIPSTAGPERGCAVVHTGIHLRQRGTAPCPPRQCSQASSRPATKAYNHSTRPLPNASVATHGTTVDTCHSMASATAPAITGQRR
jgi:hypothetical protein